MEYITNISRQVQIAAVAAAVAVIALAFLYTAAEPQITHSQVASSTFSIQQTITAESSFLVPPADIIMNGTINGLTGGQATGSTQFVVLTNNAAGYRVDIDFENNGTPNAMLGDTTASEALRDYGGDIAGPEPSRGYSASTSAQFAYTVTSSSTADTDASFFHPAGAGNCGSGGSQVDVCWKAPDTSAFTIVQRTSSAITGATSTVTFNVTVPSGAVPVPEAETYTATATLSLFNL